MTTYECPYFAGAEFILILTDTTQKEPSTCHVRVKVLQTYPFTKSQGMQVAILSTSYGYKGYLPPVAFLKLFDRRFLDERGPLGDDPWNQEKEAKAQAIHQKIQPQLVESDILVHNNGSPSSEQRKEGQVVVDETTDFNEDDYKEELESYPDIDAVNQWVTEMEYRYETTSWFKTEWRAYRQLRQLQGISVPICYGTISFDKSSELPFGIDTDVPGILLEFIDGITLEDVDIQSSISIQYPYIAEAVLECYNRIARFGVIQNDMRLANIMVNNDGRISLIDFAFALFRGAGVSEEDWDGCVKEQGEVSEAKFFLDRKGLRDKTPPMPHSNNFGDFSGFNSLITTARESWQLRYYERSFFGYSPVLDGFDGDGNASRIFLPEWFPKYRAMAERKIYLNRMRIRYKELFELEDLSNK